MYKELLRPLLFQIDPEKVHNYSYSTLLNAFRVPFSTKIAESLYCLKDPKLEREVFGLKFPNPVGLAAGFDKNARLVDEFSHFGFGFIEIGTVTPRPQPGNDKPRLFRLPADQAIINRMGFNNQGAETAAHRLKYRKSNIIIGGNIGKNKDTPNEQAVRDYEKCFDALYDAVDYFVVNVSSPNTPGLRELQDKEPLTQLLAAVQKKNQAKAKPKPLLLKIAPDLTDSQLDDIVEIAKETNLAGIIATNTTISRENLETHLSDIQNIGAGGLSGKPLKERATEVIKYLREKLPENIRIIGVGGIMTAEDAIEKLNAGADLIQLYTGFVYEGPALIKAINQKILSESTKQ